MTASPGAVVSIADRVKPIAAGESISAVHFVGSACAFVLGESVLFVADGAEQRVEMDGGVLASTATASRVIIGGDNGQVCAIDAQGRSEVVSHDAKGRWIDQIAVGPDGAIAFSAGKSVFVRTAKGEERSLDLPSSAGGVAFAPKGFRLAIAHYNGASLWFPNASAKPEFLEWKGSHLGVTFSPDGKFIVTTMQEPMLHGWRLADAKHMRMSGYAAKVRALSWSADKQWLATSGSDQLILWPFQGKDGPMGKQPRMLAPRDKRVVAVACHPAQEVVAIGYADGVVMLVRLSDGAEILVRRADGAEVSTLAWGAAGDRLAYGTESGEGGLVTL